MMTRRRRWLMAAILVVTTSSPTVMRAQGAPLRASEQREARRVNATQREALEKRFRERIEAIVTERLQLTDEQQVKLRDVASRTEAARLVLHREEFVLRSALREEMRAGDKANEAKVGDLLDQLPRLERRKLDLMVSEQRELTKFLSSTQRARYFGLQDELRRGMQDVQRRRLGKDGPPDAPTDFQGSRRRGPPPPI